MTIDGLRRVRSTRQKIVKRLDSLLHDIVVLRDKKCVTCGSREQLTAGHLFTRSYGRIKYDLMNVFCQCRSCNFAHEYRPDVFTHWFLKTYGEKAYEDLYLEAHKPPVPMKVYQFQEIERQFKVIKETLEQ